VAPFLLLLTTGASVAAGRLAHLPALTLAAGLLIHGHARFLFFVPVAADAALLLARRSGAPAWRAMPRAATGAVAGLLQKVRTNERQKV
jgi:hypothetical protein